MAQIAPRADQGEQPLPTIRNSWGVIPNGPPNILELSFGTGVNWAAPRMRVDGWLAQGFHTLMRIRRRRSPKCSRVMLLMDP